MESIDDLYVRGLESGDVEPIITAMRRGLNIHQIPDEDFDPEDPTYHSIIDDAIRLNSPVLNALVELGTITEEDLANRRMEIAERDDLDEVEHEYLRRLDQVTDLARREHEPDVPRRIVNRNGEEEWYLRGELHREDGPAVIRPDEPQEWWYEGSLRRIAHPNGMNEIYPEGESEPTIEWQDENGEPHRVDGPAIISPDGSREWWIHGEHQRSEGPAEVGDQAEERAEAERLAQSQMQSEDSRREQAWREQAWREGERQAEIEGEQLAREFAELRALSSLDELRDRAEQLSARAREARATRDSARDDTLERIQASRRYERLRALAEHAESLHADEFVRRREAERAEAERAEADRLAREYQELYAPDPEIERQQAERDAERAEADRLAREYQELYAPDPEIERRQAEAERAERQRQRDVERSAREAERAERQRQKEAERVAREQQKEAERVAREQRKLEKKLERAGLLDYYRELETSGYNFPQTHKEILEHVEGYRDARAETMREEQPVQASLLPPPPQYQAPQRQYQAPQRQYQAPQRQYQAPQRQAPRVQPNLANEFLARGQAPQRQAPSNLANEFLAQQQARQAARQATRQATRDSLAREFAELERRQNMERVFMEQQIQPLTNPVEIDTIVKEFNNAQAYDRAVLENKAMDFERAIEDEDADFHARREHEAQFLPFDEQTEREGAHYGPQADYRGLREPQIRIPSGQVIPPRGSNSQGQIRLVMQPAPQQPAPSALPANFIRGPASEYVPRAQPAILDPSYDVPERQGSRRGMEVAGMRGPLARRY